MILIFLVLVFDLPAFAKSHDTKTPISCTDLWIAVTNTLHNAANYTVVGTDPEHMKASFVVVGSLYRAMNAVSLIPREKGCEMNVRMGFTGLDDQAAFRRRVGRSLKKLRAAKLTLSDKTAETM